jgi:hypothetical protein
MSQGPSNVLRLSVLTIVFLIVLIPIYTAYALPFCASEHGGAAKVVASIYIPVIPGLILAFTLAAYSVDVYELVRFRKGLSDRMRDVEFYGGMVGTMNPKRVSLRSKLIVVYPGSIMLALLGLNKYATNAAQIHLC